MFHRHITDPLLEALSDRPVVLLHGARQTGKTTLVRHLAETVHPARYLTLDDAAVAASATADPQGFIAGLDTPVVLDEVQRAPGLFVAIKAAVDWHRRPGRFLLTGSADILLLPTLSESLAGRMELLTLYPLSAGELTGVQEGFVDVLFGERLPQSVEEVEGASHLVARILTGSFPEVVGLANADRRAAWFGSYVTTILQRDIRDFARIEGLSVMPRLLALLGARPMALLNYAELARSAGLPQSTLKRYMALLEAAFLVQVLPAWSANLRKRLVKAPKILTLDTGLSGYLMGMDEGRLRGDQNLMGPLLEAYVVMEVRKQICWSQTRPRLFHYRSHDGLEVDMVLEGPGGRLVGIEVKASATMDAAGFKGLRVLAEAVPKRFHRGIVLYTGTEVVPFGPKLHAVPVSALWNWKVSPQERRR